MLPEYSGCGKSYLRASSPHGKVRSRDARASWIGHATLQANGATPNLRTRRVYREPFCHRGLSGDITSGLTAPSPDGRLTPDFDGASQHIPQESRPEGSGFHTSHRWASVLGGQTLGRIACNQLLNVYWCCMPYTGNGGVPFIQMGAPGPWWPT